MSLLADIFSIAAISAGAFFYLAGTVGLLRFPDTLCRLHALTKADNLGLGLVTAGLLPQMDSLAAALKLIVIWILVVAGGTSATQIIANRVTRKP